MLSSLTISSAILAVKGLLILWLGTLLGFGAYAGWTEFVTIPRLETKALKADVYKSNAEVCEKANSGLAGAVDRQNEAIKGLSAAIASSQGETKKAFGAMAATVGDVQARLDAFKPDPTKSDCENALVELQLFREQRQRKAGAK